MPIAMMLRVVGSASMMSRVNTTAREACETSTVGVAPDTVTVSSSAPTFNSAFTVAVKLPGRSTAARTTVENPSSENVIL